MDLNQKLDNLEFQPPDHVWTNIQNKKMEEANGIHDLKITPPESCWTKIEAQIDRSKKKAINNNLNSRSIYPTWMRYAAILIGVTFASVGLMNDSIRNKFFNAVVESKVKTSLSDKQQLLNSTKKKSDTQIQLKTTHPQYPMNKN